MAAAPTMADLPLEIGPAELAKLRAGGAAHTLLDVREPWEIAICGFADALCIPLASLAARQAALPKGQPLVVVCHTGRRSLLAAQVLRRSGFSGATSLRGGVEDWALTIDPTMARY